MKIIFALICVIVAVECGNTFLGNNILKPLVYHKLVKHNANFITKRIETYNFTMPEKERNYGWTIQGILAYDQTATDASLNVTRGGLGHDFVELRMESAMKGRISYDLYIYGGFKAVP